MAAIQAAGSGQAAPAAPSAPAKPDSKLLKATEDFASMLWQEVLHTALPTDTLMGDSSGGADIYGGIVEQGFADAVSRGDNGLAKMVFNSLTNHGQGQTPNKLSDPQTP
jgi:hypothetical protein